LIRQLFRALQIMTPLDKVTKKLRRM
jgi:hypothetical protein